MYDFHYNHVKATYNHEAKLLFTDTDSLCYEIKTNNIYADIASHIDFYDTSDYPPTHPLHSTVNKKVLGKMKDECAGAVVEEFVGLRSKMYSLMFDGRVKKTAKGITKAAQTKLKHAMYKDCLLQGRQIRSQMNQIRSKDHQLYSISLNKIGLSPFDDKRYVLNNGSDTLAHGHYKISN